MLPMLIFHIYKLQGLTLHKSYYAHNKQQSTLDVYILNVTLTLPNLRHKELIQIQEK